ncbi:hypothetical protein [Butyrivibrio sp. INlla16]|uniref:hypothetical protein n=1 Tax=Butyrivibrio sp. INlla16 TaxID=1520807 RepID=UPI00088BE355|nr:hypothetical protein [Butyrivibrio sp. INlla16]SDB49834.1 hypothetical protein SAMN02910263_02474 [Butyrivibrio sp. INlla16]
MYEDKSLGIIDDRVVYTGPRVLIKANQEDNVDPKELEKSRQKSLELIRKYAPVSEDERMRM